jgi:hypothetical protein
VRVADTAPNAPNDRSKALINGCLDKSRVEITRDFLRFPPNPE